MRTRFVTPSVAALAISAFWLSLFGSSAADAQNALAVDAGDVRIVLASEPAKSLAEGDSNTVFSVRLPPGAACPGDSANDDWRVQSFIVPADVDLEALVYGATRPRGEHQYALYTTEGRPYVQVLLPQNAEPGLPAPILDAPPLSFSVFTPDLLPLGRYKVGIACTYFDVGSKYWDTEIVLSEDKDAKPAERAWRLAGVDGAAVASADGGASPIPTWLVITVATSLIAVIGLWARRRRSQTRNSISPSQGATRTSSIKEPTP